MRRLRRPELSTHEFEWLRKQTAKIQAQPDSVQKAEAEKRWISAKKNQAKNPLRHIQNKLQAMCSGKERCMYCEDSQGSAIEHFWPRSLAPLRTFVWENLNYGCAHCNTAKKAQFPRDPDDSPQLIDPTAEDPLVHLLLIPRTGEFTPRCSGEAQQESVKGRKSIDTFALNRPILSAGRRDAWIVLQELLIAYDAARTAEDAPRAEVLRATLRTSAFSSVLLYLLRQVAQGPAPPAATLLRPECLAAISRRPEIFSWSDE